MMTIGAPFFLSPFSELEVLNFLASNGNPLPFSPLSSLSKIIILLLLAIHPPFSSLISLRTLSCLVVGDVNPPPFFPLSSFKELWSLLLQATMIHPCSLLSHLSQSFELLLFKVLNSHLANDGDPPPPPLLSSFNFFKAKSFFIVLFIFSHLNYYDWCVFSPLDPNLNLLIYFFHLLCNYYIFFNYSQLLPFCQLLLLSLIYCSIATFFHLLFTCTIFPSTTSQLLFPLIIGK